MTVATRVQDLNNIKVYTFQSFYVRLCFFVVFTNRSVSFLKAKYNRYAAMCDYPQSRWLATKKNSGGCRGEEALHNFA